MSTYFVDTSALGRRYLNEIGTAWAQTWLSKMSGNVITVSEITPVEMFSTFARLHRTGAISPVEYAIAQNSLLTDLDDEYLVIPMDTALLLQARTLVTKHPLRALDAIQLASALNLVTFASDPVTFISGDTRLLTAASAERFATDNPYSHP